MRWGNTPPISNYVPLPVKLNLISILQTPSNASATLQADSAMSLYLQLKQWLLTGIEAGRWEPGERFPGDDELA